MEASIVFEHVYSRTQSADKVGYNRSLKKIHSMDLNLFIVEGGGMGDYKGLKTAYTHY